MTTVAVLVALGIVPLVVTIRAAGRRRADVEARRSTVRALRHLVATIETVGAGRRDSADVVARSISELLHLRGCRFEPQATDDGTPTLDRDGDIGALVQRRAASGIVLPARTALLAGPGRFVLLADPKVGTTIEQRLVAIALGQLAVEAGPPRRHSTTLPASAATPSPIDRARWRPARPS